MNTVLEAEVQKFSKDSRHWWDPDGPFAPLHRLNPVRLSYIKRQICAHFERDESGFTALKGLSVLDIGCGGGLVCEPMARMGANVTGIDADQNAIAVAQDHAKESALDIGYQNQTAESMTEKYDIVLALEVIEHVSDPAAFAQSCAALAKPGGLVIFSTLNRTAKSFALGIVAAEYILRWVPQGTHEWKKFLKPSELSRHARQSGLTPHDLSGLIFNPFSGEFTLSTTDLDVNYFLTCTR